MRILIADDDPIARRLLEATLVGWGYEVTVARDGLEAWAALEAADPPKLAILDWMMPGMDGPETCRKVRDACPPRLTYLMLLTSNKGQRNIVTGLEAGADDYLTKPFHRDELRARVAVGARVLELQTRLADRVAELQAALARVKQLQGLLPICCYCKRIRVDNRYWQQVEVYISERSNAEFTHGICPACYDQVIKEAV